MSTTETIYDLTVIGGGPGGYVCALRAAQLGLKTAVVEEAPLPGGTCLHWGCIPTKVLLRTAEVMDTAASHAKKYGVMLGKPELDLARTHKFKKRIVTTNAKGIELLLKEKGVDLLNGRGRLAEKKMVHVTAPDGETRTVRTGKIVLATGSEVMPLPGIEFDGKRILHSDHALDLAEVPKTAVVLGAGAVGVEFASILASFGAKVTIVELLDRLIPLEDEDLGAELERSFKRRRIDSHTGTRVEKVQRTDECVKITAARGEETLRMEADILLVAVGRRPRTSGIGIEDTGVETERGYVKVDENMLTAEPDVYAIGDIVPTPALAHVASHEGIVAAEHAAGERPHPINYDKVPSCTYCSPEVASIGLSEKTARDRDYAVGVGTFPFTAVGKAKILDDTRGFVKVVSDLSTDRVLGVHIIGPHATELIAEAIAALHLDATTTSLFQAMHAHPTLAESMAEAAMAVHDRALHL